MRLARVGWLLLAVVVGVLAVIWVVQDEVVHASIQVGNAVPPIPALTAVLILGIAAYAAGRRGWTRICNRKHALRIYIFLTIAAAIPGTASMGFFFAYLTLPQYLASTQKDMARIASQFPRWFAPPPGEAIRQFYEGSPGGVVPWSVWIGPLLAWGCFLFTLLLTLYALLALLRQSWMESERLTYPIVQLPLQLLGSETQPPIWRNPLMWLGFGLVAAFDGMNMLHAFYPWMPSMGTSYEFGSLFPARPWSALAPIAISYRPEIFGIGYLMPTEVLFTTWMSYLALRLSTVSRVALGEQVASTSYDYQELGMGAFLCLFVILLWRARLELRWSLGEALGRHRRQAEATEPLSPRAAWLIVLLGTVFMVAWLYLAGLPIWLGTTHLLLLIAVSIVYARVRAETGATSVYLFPFWQQQTMITNLLGSQFISGSGERALTIFSSLGGLSRGYYPEICACGGEGMSLAAQARFSQRHVTMGVIASILLGLGLGGYLYVLASYHYGANLLDNGSGHGGYRVYIATQQYNSLLAMTSSPVLPKPDLIFQTCLGALIVLAFNMLRQRFFWFSLHPLGFAMATAYGYHLWAPFLAVWAVKVLILRLGGDRTYRRLMPLFVGIVLGRYLFVGIIWGLLGLTGNPVTGTYEVMFS